jgi:hypothetical protein
LTTLISSPHGCSSTIPVDQHFVDPAGLARCQLDSTVHDNIVRNLTFFVTKKVTQKPSRDQDKNLVFRVPVVAKSEAMPPKKSPSTKRPAENPEREHRILYEIVVDAYNDTERAMGWYYYLQDALQFPFDARCISTLGASRLEIGQVVKVVSMADELDCMSEVLVTIKLGRSKMAVPLAQLESLSDEEGTQQAVEDWHYWVGRGYQY